MTAKTSLDRRALFRLYYRTNYWGDPATRSGDSSRPGRAIAATNLLRHITDRNPQVRILDVGCGDFSWRSQIRLPPTCEYTGLDIVPEVIESNARLYGTPPRLRFMVSDAAADDLPPADVILIRDLFIHLEDDEIVSVLRSVLHSHPSLLIASSYRGASGQRILERWNFAPMDLESDQYGLGPAEFFLPEAPGFDRPEDGIKGLACWRYAARIAIDLGSLSSGGEPVDGVCRPPDLLPSTRLVGRPRPNWSICADGRGFAYFAFDTKGSRRPRPGEVRVRPRYAAFSAMDRRLTKQRPCKHDVTVMGRQCVVVVEEVAENCGDLVPHDFCLVREQASGPDESPSGYLSDSVVTSHSCLLKLPTGKEPYLFLLAYPLSCALAAQPLLEELEASGLPLTAAIWGAGTAGLLMAEMLRCRCWEVVVSDLFAPESLPAKVAVGLGATYEQATFDFEPAFEPSLSIDSSGDPASTATALRCTRRQGRVILWPEEPMQPSDHLDERLTILGSPNDDFVDDAVGIIQERFGELMVNLIADIAPVWEFDRALFPRIPNRTAVVRID